VEYLIDSTLWIDSLRPKSSAPLKAQSTGWIKHPEAVTCQPVIFELLRNAKLAERRGFRATTSAIQPRTFS
jgi:predicted nucleic acid-binding protein